MKQLLLGLVIVAMAASTGYAHGGSYRGPAGEVPPNMRKPEDPPPPNDQGTPTPPPEENNPTPTPPPQNQPPVRPGAPPPEQGGDNGGSKVVPKAPGQGGQGGAITGQGKSNGPPPTTYDSWEFWWGYNKDDLLNLKARLKAGEGGQSTESDGGIGIGSGIEKGPGGTQAPTEIAIQQKIIPALKRCLDDVKMNFDIRAGAVIAMGKIGATQPKFTGEIAKRLIDIMNNADGQQHFSVEESGALALGLLQSKDPEILTALCDKALDVRGKTKNQRTRSFALIALGLLQVTPNDTGFQNYVETLRKAASESTLEDIPVCAFTAMGLSGDAKTFLPDLVATVKEGKYHNQKFRDLVVSYAASAIGKLAETNPDVGNDKDVLDVLKKAMINASDNTVRSAVIAFGQIGGQPGVDAKQAKEMVHSLEYIVKRGENQAASFALISLGKIGAVVEDGSLRNHIFDTLNTEMKKGTYTKKPFAALALGLMGRSPLVQDSSRKTICESVRFEFDEFRGDPKNRGGYAIALGLLHDRDAVDSLIKVLEDRGQVKRLRGACAVALGMIGAPKALKAIKSALEEKEDRDLRVDTAVAAGLIGSSDTIKTLVDILSDPKASLFVQGSVSLALGRIGDYHAIEPLVSMLENPKVEDLNRALAAVALGLLGDRNDLPVLGRLAKDVNYRASINSIDEVLTIL